MQVLIKFADPALEQEALGKLIPRFSGKSWASGEIAVSTQALAYLAEQGLQFTVLGPTPYDLVTPLRSLAAAAV